MLTVLTRAALLLIMSVIFIIPAQAPYPSVEFFSVNEPRIDLSLSPANVMLYAGRTAVVRV